MKPILSTYWRSSCSFRVRIALGYKKVEYEPLLVNLLEGDQKKPAHLAKNPFGHGRSIRKSMSTWSSFAESVWRNGRSIVTPAPRS